jgi:hypothetical protein
MCSPSAVASQPGWKPYRNVSLSMKPLFSMTTGLTDLDTLKLYTKAHGAKVSQLQSVIHVHVRNTNRHPT